MEHGEPMGRLMSSVLLVGRQIDIGQLNGEILRVTCEDLMAPLPVEPVGVFTVCTSLPGDFVGF